MELNTTPFTDSGFEILSALVSSSVIDSIADDIVSTVIEPRKGGIRNAEKKYASIQQLITSKELINKARCYVSGEPKVVKVIYFDKTPENNWLVSWHQDRTVAVSKRFNLEGWKSWSIKDGTHHAQPPLEVLNNMITFRIHIDDSNEENGCLKIIAGSHKDGVLSQEEIQKYCKDNDAISCVVSKGSALAMRPHLLHASSKATTPRNRRVIHVEYCGSQLPPGVSWA